MCILFVCIVLLNFKTNIFSQLNEIGSILENVCRIVPAGVVCFFPSYDYEELVYQHLEKNKNINRLLEKKKVIYIYIYK